ncbi:MAG: hypothetical protein Q9M48_14265 [Rhodobacterales bacterium]|nr:hypothetical protein [Rhodobacterales bacterium]
MIQNDLVVQSAALLERLNGLGFDILAEDDFEVIQAKVTHTGKEWQSPMFSLMRNDFTRGSAFWAFLMKDDVEVGGVAARYYDLRSESLESYLHRTSSAQYGGGDPAIESIAKPVSENIGGRLVYFGELYFTKAARGNIKVLSTFARLSVILAAMSWPDFDWLYAFIPKEQIRFADAYGFTYRLPKAITWKDPEPLGRRNSHVLIALSKSDFWHLLSSGELSEL